MYATVFLILVRQRRRARAPLTLCAQCRHKYAIYASVWPALARVSSTCTRKRVFVHVYVHVYVRVYVSVNARVRVCVYVYGEGKRHDCSLRKTCHTRVTSRSHGRVYCMAKRGPMFSPAPCIWTPYDLRVSSRGFFSCFEQSGLFLPFYIPTLATAAIGAHSFAFLSLRHNCCNLRFRVVDLTVDLSHGNLLSC